jgi:hypothetical protein
MKRLLLMLGLALFLSACGAGDKPAATQAPEAEAPAPTSDVVQMDFSGLNDTMAYAQMFNVVNNPKEYVGTTVKIKGTYVPIPDPTREGLTYHFLVVADITACCEIGVEFFLDGYRYPQDYPTQFSQVELTGRFEMASVGGQEHISLKADSMKVLKVREN